MISEDHLDLEDPGDQRGGSSVPVMSEVNDSAAEGERAGTPITSVVGVYQRNPISLRSAMP